MFSDSNIIGFSRLTSGVFFLERDLDHAALNARSQEEQLQIQLARMEMVCMALWSLLKEKTNLSDDDLSKRIEEIHGAQDGNSTAVPMCPQCNRPMSPRLHRCLYCGYTQPAGEFGVFQNRRRHKAESNRQRRGNQGVARWKTRLSAQTPPILHIHGTADNVVPVHHAHLLAEAAARIGAPVDILLQQDGGHCVAGNEEDGKQADARIWNFFARHLHQAEMPLLITGKDNEAKGQA